jgi:vacuolar-type H+-ATPase subunit I/STV1
VDDSNEVLLGELRAGLHILQEDRRETNSALHALIQRLGSVDTRVALVSHQVQELGKVKEAFEKRCEERDERVTKLEKSQRDLTESHRILKAKINTVSWAAGIAWTVLMGLVGIVAAIGPFLQNKN